MKYMIGELVFLPLYNKKGSVVVSNQNGSYGVRVLYSKDGSYNAGSTIVWVSESEIRALETGIDLVKKRIKENKK